MSYCINILSIACFSIGDWSLEISWIVDCQNALIVGYVAIIVNVVAISSNEWNDVLTLASLLQNNGLSYPNLKGVKVVFMAF